MIFLIRRKKKQSGFTLIEVLVIMVILGLLFRSAPDLRKRLRDEELDQTVRTAVQFFRYAQYRAIAEGEPILIEIDRDKKKYQLKKIVESPDQRIDYLPLKGEWGRPIQLKKSLKVDSRSENITFYEDGSTSGGRLVFKNLDRQASLEVKAGLGRVNVDIRRN